MPTGLSSTEPTAALSPARGDRSGAWAEVRRATSDTRALLSFRASTLRGTRN